MPTFTIPPHLYSMLNPFHLSFPNHECRSVFCTDTMPYSLINLHLYPISNPYQTHHFNSMNHPIQTSCSNHVKTHKSRIIIRPISYKVTQFIQFILKVKHTKPRIQLTTQKHARDSSIVKSVPVSPKPRVLA